MTGFLGFTLAGLVGGLLVGLLDATHGPGLVVAVDAAIGAGMGAAAGLLYPLIPPALRALPLLRRGWARLLPGADDALQDRCRTISGIWLLAIGLPVFLLALEAVEPLLLSRVRSRLLAALAVALVGLALTGLALALAAPIFAGLARGLETLVRRRPTAALVTRPDAHLALALVAGAGLWVTTHGGLALPDLPVLAGGLLVLTTLVGGELCVRLGARRLVVLLVPGLALVAWGARAALADPTAREALPGTPALGTVLRALKPPAAPTHPESAMPGGSAHLPPPD